MTATPDRLLVFLDGTLAGEVTQDRHGKLAFSYDTAYLDAPVSGPLSWSMPLGVPRHTKPVRPFLRGLLPDSQDTLARWAGRYGVSPRNPFALLAHVGEDAAGAVQILTPDAATGDADQRGDVEWLTDRELSDILASLSTHSSDWDTGRDSGRWSLAGAQSKVALYRGPDGRFGIPRDGTPTTHILKPDMPSWPGHVVNEHVCLAAAARLGIPTAASALLTTTAGQIVFSVERYDRGMRPDGTWRRLHQEDMCQALAVDPDLKYQDDGGPGVHAIAGVLTALPGHRDREASTHSFLKMLAFNVAIGATDGHAKNYSLMHLPGRARLAPAYDIASILPYPHHDPVRVATTIGEHSDVHRISTSDWEKVGSHLGISRDETINVVRGVLGSAADAVRDAVAALPAAQRPIGGRLLDAVASHTLRWQRLSPTRPTPAIPSGAEPPRIDPESPTHPADDHATSGGHGEPER